MALNYLSGRLSRASFGIPGFSTSGDLTVDVAGSLGIGTTQPRAEIDTPNVHIRGDIVDSRYLTGGVGYFLTQDVEGVRWVAASPLDLTFIRIFENDVQEPGLSSASGLNFRSPDPFFLNIQQNPTDPNLADINYDVRWLKYQYGSNFGIATGFGTDGTWASVPGYGTSDAVGVTSVGVGTNQPQDDFQVGIGSTGVQINGPLGRVDAQIIKAKQLELDGNLSARSLVIDPGIATFRGRIDAQGISSFTADVFIGFASITDSRLGVSTIDRSQIGFATIGPVGAGATNEPALFVTGLSTFAGIVTTLSDLYVGKDLYVAGQQFIKQLNADNILVTGIATLNQVEAAGIAVTEFSASGFSTFQDISFNVGTGTALTVDFLRAGVATVQDAVIGVSTIGFASITNANVTGIVTVTEVDVEDIVIERADVGILTVGTALSVTGFSTFIGLTTFVGNVFVDGDLTVTQQFNVKDLGAENLEVTGIATINNLDFNVGIGTSLRLETIDVGIGTFQVIIGAAGTIGGVGFDSGKVTADEIDADRGRIGILTGTEITYQIGTISDFQSDIAGITTLSGQNLTYFGDSFINGAFFNDGLVTLTENLEVLGITTFRGVGTFGTDLYVGNDLFVAGELVFKQLIGENLLVSGVGTINTLKFDVGIGTTARIENLFAHVGVITDLTGSASTITNMTSQSLVVDNPLDPDFPGVFPVPPPPGTAYIQNQISEFIVALERIQSNGDLEVAGFTTTGDLEVTRTAYIEDLTFNVGFGTDLELEFLRVGIVTIGETDIGFASVTEAEVGIATITDLNVLDIANFNGPVFIDDYAIIRNSVTGIATINTLFFEVGTGGTIFLNEANIGVASVGLVTAGEVETTVLRAYESIVGFSTVGLQTIGTGNSESSALFVTGITTFVGFTTFSGDVFIDGNLTVNGITTFTQLDAQQSQIGILTVFNILDSQRDSFLNNVAIAGSFVASGVSTIGLSTFTPDGDVNVNRNLTVGGITTFTGVVNIDNTAFINAEVTGVATINNLYVNVGLATEFNVDLLQARVGVITDLTVTGPSTFVGLSTFQDDVFIADDLFVARNMEVGNIATTRFLDVTEQATIVGADIGIATVGFATVQEAFVGVLTTGTLTIETLDVLGVATFRGDVEIDANLDVVGVTTTGDFDVTGIATINEARIGFASITDSITGLATIGIATVGFASVGVNTLTSALTVTGLSTFTGFTTFKGDVFIDGNLDVTGFTSFTKIAADFGLIGILTVTKFLDANDVRVTGFTTLTDYDFRVGVGSTLNVVDANVSGILSTRNLFIEEDLDVGRNLSVTGITTLGDPLNPTAGFTTTAGDLFVGNNLFVRGDIFYDEIVGRNLLITGIATIRELRYAVGFGTTANIENLNFDVGVGGTLTVDDINVGVISVGLVTAGDVIIGGALTVIGPSNFNDIVTIQPQLDVLGDLNVTGISSLPLIISEFAQIDGIIGVAGTFERINTDDLEVLAGVATISVAEIGFLDVLGIGTIPNLFADTVEVSGVTSTSNLIVSNNATIEDLVVNNNTFLQDLIVQGGSQFLGPATFFGDVTVTGIVTVTEVDVQDLTINNTLTVNGIATFNAGLTVNGGPLDVTTTINSPDASISTLRSLDINVDNLVVNEDLLVIEDSTFGRNVQVNGITTTTNLDVPGQAQVTNLNVAGFGTIGILTAPIGTIDILTFSDATGTNLTVDFAQIQDLIVGVVTVTELDIARAQVGLLTVTQELDIKDIRIENAYRLQTNVTGPQLAFNIPAQYRAFEVTVLAQEGANFQTTKLNGINDGVDVFFNEYSDVFNTGQVGTYSFVFNGLDNSTDFFIDPASANVSNFSMTLTALNT